MTQNTRIIDVTSGGQLSRNHRSWTHQTIMVVEKLEIKDLVNI